MMKTFHIIILFLMLFTLIPGARAQVVNIEEKRTQKENGLQGNTEFSYNFIKTSQTSRYLGNKIKLQYFVKQHTFLLFNDLSWAKVDTNNFINSGFQHFRYNYTFNNKWLTLEVFAQHQYNKLTGIERRILGGAGPRFRISDNAKLRFYTGPLVMYEYELRTDRGEDYYYRLSWYLSLNYKATGFVTFNLVNYYQPEINNFNDFRLSTEGSITFHLHKYMKFKASAESNYDSEPPAGIDKLNYTVKNSLIFEF